ncbi:MAG: S8 family serine peptidase [Blastocatellia bacterium]|nr:S8 family serine peptidase [Blastocatellia bacterium]
MADNQTCPICQRSDAQLLYDFDEAFANFVQANVPDWPANDGLCHACLELFRSALSRLERTSTKIFHDGEYRILPTPLRMGANEKLTGRGVTIAFLDSGFFPHPDLTRPHNRIKHYVNVADPHASPDEYHTPDVSSWHGMMTSVVAAGNGHLSGGLYRGIASNAKVVLVKVGKANRIYHDDITRGLQWVIENRERYNIRIVNVSCGGDYQASYLTDELSQTAEAAVRAGIVVVAAAGNSGHSPDHPVLPPASAPAVITVGGVNDRNTLEFDDNEPFHSSYGPTIDGLQKPEIIAPSIWVAAPILPGTPTAAEAELLTKLRQAPDHELREILEQNEGINAELDVARNLPPYLIRQLISLKTHDANVIHAGGGNYKHVDGTSFAAPIVSSVIAQMIEANPRLTPQQIKRILIDTSIRLKEVEIDRQGWGMMIPARAIEFASAA